MLIDSKFYTISLLENALKTFVSMILHRMIIQDKNTAEAISMVVILFENVCSLGRHFKSNTKSYFYTTINYVLSNVHQLHHNFHTP